MSELDKVISEAVAKQDAPFLVAMMGNAAGVTWSGAAGERSPGQPATVDTVFRIFSMTKAIGSTAAMILIDRGKLSPDTTVESILPEFADAEGAGGLRRGGSEAARAARQGDGAASGDPHVGPGVRVLERGRAALHGGDRMRRRSCRG